MISHATLLANDGLDLIMEQQKQQSTVYGIDSIEPKCQELEEMKKKLTEQIDEKRHNLKLLRTYVDKLESVKQTKSFFLQICKSLDKWMVYTWERYVSNASYTFIK
jgi:hypothetical protein